MKTLFRKSNILHIRTNEGEFEVSNPEIIGDPETIKIIFNDGKPFGGMPIEPVWPGGVELIVSTEGVSTKAVARLLPKEEKKELFVKALDDIQKIENLSVNNSAHSFTESAYKELEEAAIKQGHVIESPEPYFESLLDYIDDQYLLNFNKGLIDLNELEKRTRNAIELYIESEIKALREENTKCKDLSWEAANEISRLKKEIETLEAEVLKEKFPEN